MPKISKADIPPIIDVARVHLALLDVFERAVQNEERSAEQQVKFFISLVTGIVAVIAVLQRLEGFTTDQLFWIVEISLFVLFSFGILTVSRINWRSINSDKFAPLIRQAHESIQTLDPSFDSYLEKWDAMCANEIEGNWFARRIRGSMGQFMILAEAFIATGFLLNLGLRLQMNSVFLILANVSMFVLVLVSLSLWSKYVRNIIHKGNN
jgi:hypothetical protein